MNVKNKKLKKGETLYITDKNDLDERFKNVFYVVEANSNENQQIWRDINYSVNGYLSDMMNRQPLVKREAEFDYEQDNSGLFFPVGDFYGENIMVNFSFFKLNGLTILSYYPTSQVVNHRIIDAWFDQHCSPYYEDRLCISDANNIHNVLNAVRNKTKKQQERKKVIKKLLTE